MLDSMEREFMESRKITESKEVMESYKDVECAIDEYKLLWSYYQKILDERKNLFDWYFKVVTLPATVVGYIASGAPGSPDIPVQVIASLLFIIFLVGLTLYITYAKESSNAGKYECAMKSLRSFFRKKMPTLDEVIVIDDLRAKKSTLKGFGSIKAWRGASIGIINSAIGVISISLLCTKFSLRFWAISYLVLLLSHVILYSVMFSIYEKASER